MVVPCGMVAVVAQPLVVVLLKSEDDKDAGMTALPCWGRSACRHWLNSDQFVTEESRRPSKES